MKPKTRMDYVELYAKKLRNEPLLFEQQRQNIAAKQQRFQRLRAVQTSH